MTNPMAGNGAAVMRVTLLALGLVLGLVCACLDPTKQSTTSGDAHAGASEVAGDGSLGTRSDAGTNAACSGPGHTQIFDPQWVESCAASVIDQEGRPVGDQPVLLCGLNYCLRATTDANGKVNLSTSKPLSFDLPAFKPDLGFTYAEFAFLVPRQSTLDLGIQRAVRLPELGSGDPLVAGKAAQSSGIRLDIAVGARIVIDLVTYSTDEHRRFRATNVPPSLFPQAVDVSLGFDWVVAMTPVGTTFCPPAKLAMPNHQGWSPGTIVELFLHGTDIMQTFAPYGGWAKITEAVVTLDGTEISTTTPGLPVLGAIGVRRKN